MEFCKVTVVGDWFIVLPVWSVSPFSSLHICARVCSPFSRWGLLWLVISYVLNEYNASVFRAIQSPTK